MEMEWLPLALVLAVALASAITDARTGHIPNAITLPAIALGPIVHGLAFGVGASLLSIVALCSCAIVPYFLFRRDAMGGGDVKLFAALGAVAGPTLGIELQLATFLVAGFWVFGRLAYRGRLFATLGNAGRMAMGAVAPRVAETARAPELEDSIRLGAPALAAALLVLAIRQLDLVSLL